MEIDEDLFLAVNKNQLQQVDDLIKRSANINATASSLIQFKTGIHEGDYPIHVAAYNGYTKILARLLEAGAHINARDSAGRSALYYSIEDHCPSCKECTTLLLNNRAHVDVQDYRQRTILYAACDGNISLDTEDLRLLMEYGADVNFFGRHGLTPLLAAIESNRANIKMIQLFFDYGVNLNAKNNQCKTLYQLIFENPRYSRMHKELHEYYQAAQDALILKTLINDQNNLTQPLSSHFDF